MQNLLDRALGKYVILEEIGRGGMAAVYKARDIELDRIVAMKVLSPYLVGEPRLVQRFMGEARLAANLDHPNIVTIYDIGGEGGYYYFVMKYLEGRTLKQVLVERAPLPLEETVSIVRQLAGALDYAHGQNLIHRDVKPGNVILSDDGHAVLTDFGLAKVAENLKLTASGETIGTLEYMAPEQARGDAEERSDIYSLGVMTYEMLTGKLPFQGTNQATLLYQHLHDPPPPLRQWSPDISPEIEQAVLRAMAKDPAERYQAAGELARDIEQAARKVIFPGPARSAPKRETAAARPAPAKPRAAKPRAAKPRPAKPRAARRIVLPALPAFLPPFLRRWGWLMLAGIVALTLAIVATVLFWPGRQAARPPWFVSAKEIYLPTVARGPTPRTVLLVPVELALLCDLGENAGTGWLNRWRWGQATPARWAGLPEKPIPSQMSWSPDGSSLAIVLAEQGRPDLYRLRYDGTDILRLTDLPEEKEDPVWSPDSRQIAFADGPQGERNIFLIPAEGGGTVDVAPNEADDWAPTWSPDGKSLAFVSDRDGNTEIYVVSLTDGQLQRLTNDPGHDIYPAWSPDGKKIAFVSNRSGDFRLYEMDITGQGVRPLSGSTVWPERPTWSPKGDWLAFTVKAGDNPPQVFLLNTPTGQLQPGPAGCRQPAWRPTQQGPGPTPLP